MSSRGNRSAKWYLTSLVALEPQQVSAVPDNGLISWETVSFSPVACQPINSLSALWVPIKGGVNQLSGFPHPSLLAQLHVPQT